MDRTALEAYARRSRAILESSPPTRKAGTRAWLVTPLLSTLGWDVRSDACEMDLTVRDVDLEYALSVGDDGDTPALFVAVESTDASLRSGRERRLREAMAGTGVDRAMYTNGRRIVLLAGPRGDDRQVIESASLLDHADAIAHFGADALDRRLVRHARDIAARRLAVDRSALVSSIAGELADVAGESYEAELRAESERFVDELVRSFATTAEVGGEAAPADSRTDGSNASATGQRSSSVDPGPSPDSVHEAATPNEGDVAASGDAAGDRSGDGSDATAEEWTFGAVEPATSESSDRSGEGAADTEKPPEDDEEGEYVVRFFGDQGKIGAVGASTSAGALVSTAEYLFDRGLSGIRLPWGPEGGETVINDEPTMADGSPMPAYRQLSNGYYVNTAGSIEDRAERAADLTSRAGLRAMVTGDWEWGPDE